VGNDNNLTRAKKNLPPLDCCRLAGGGGWLFQTRVPYGVGLWRNIRSGQGNFSNWSPVE
jgi:hypothetical protein